MRETTFENAIVGEAVEDIVHGEGTISRIGDSTTPIGVDFSNGAYYNYSLDGKQFGKNRRTLYWPGVKIIAPERPPREEWVEVEVVPYESRGEIRVASAKVVGTTGNCGPIQTVKVKVER